MPSREEGSGTGEERWITGPTLSRHSDVEVGGLGGWRAGGPVGDREEELQEQGLEVAGSHCRVLRDWVRMY